MADALEILNTLKTVNIDQIASDTISEVTNSIADLNAEQMAKGLRADGSEILPTYSNMTISLKKESGRTDLSGVTDRVTLFDTGSHYRNLYAQVQGVEIEYGSRDSKSADLQKKYDKQNGSIYGLTIDSREELIVSKLRDGWEKRIEDITGLKFN